MNLVWGQVKFWLLWVLVNTFALGVSFAALGSADGEQHPPNWAYTFEFRYPDFPMSIISGCFLGLMQWILLSFYFRQPLIQWAAGSTVGMMLMSQISRLGYELHTFANFNTLTSGSEDLIFSITNGAIAGFIGGLIGGCIQGCTLRHNIAWILTNAVAWAVAWSMGRAVRDIDGVRWYWTLERFPLPIKLAIEMGVLGTIAGLISSVITGVVLWQILSRDRYSL